MPRAFQRACLLIDFPLGEGAIVMRAAIFDPEQLAVTVHDREELAFVFDDAAVAGFKFGDRADCDSCGFVTHEVLGGESLFLIKTGQLRKNPDDKPTIRLGIRSYRFHLPDRPH